MPAEVVALALAGRPGPVHLDLDPTAPPGVAVAVTSLASGDIEAARAAVRDARRPLVIVGVGAVAVPVARRPAILTALTRFLDGTGIPVLTTYKARGIVDDRGPNAAGVATGATIEAPLLDQADLIIGVGLDPVELIPAPWPYRAPMVLLGGWPIDDSTFFGDRVVAEIVGDVEQLLDRLTGLATTSWSATEAAEHRLTASARIRSAVPARPTALTPQDVVTLAREEVPPGTIVTVDAGAHMLVAVPLWEVERPGELLISGGLATMGFALPAAIAAALMAPDRRVVCFTGDGGLGIALAELETLARLDLDVVVVVFNDSTLSLIAAKQRATGQGGDRAIRYATIGFAAVAAGCGVRSEWIVDGRAYRDALRRAMRRTGPTLLDVAVDPSGYPGVIEAIRG
jgi:acetolactate synthase-1/2/3 large subunit